MKASTIRPMINLGNSIVGVSILAMPYCFKECGVLLGGLLLVVSSVLTVWSCKMVLRAAHLKGKQSFESVALAVFGKTGKLFVEVSVIGLNVGSCIAFFVIIGDLAPPIVAQATGLQWSPSVLRAVVLLVLAVLVALPLALLRNIDSLSFISMCSLFFYVFLIVQLVFLSHTNFVSGVWWSDINWWRWKGLLRCLPIFSLAFACQTQLFVIYAALPDVSTRKMSTVINGAITTVAIGYGMVAVFGYVSFCTDTAVKGDILSNFSLSMISQFTRLGFATSVVVSFPLMIFPCRVSINSLLFSKASMEIHVVEPIPQKRFFFITAWIIGFTLTIAILIPQVEFVLSMTGATMGSLICYIFPSLLLLYVAGSNTEYRNRARVVLILGACVMVLSTVVILGSQPEGGEIEVIPVPKPNLDTDKRAAQLPGVGDAAPGAKREEEEPGGRVDEKEDKRHEPPQPQAPVKEGDRGGGGEEKVGGGGEKAGGDGVKVGGKGVEEKSKDAHHDIQRQMNDLHERLQKVEGENKQLKEWQKEQDQLKVDEHVQQQAAGGGDRGPVQDQAAGGGDKGPVQDQELPHQQQQKLPVENAKLTSTAIPLNTPKPPAAQDPVIPANPAGDQLKNVNANANKSPLGNVAPVARETRDLGGDPAPREKEELLAGHARGHDDKKEEVPAGHAGEGHDDKEEEVPAGHAGEGHDHKKEEVPAVHAGEGHDDKKQPDTGGDVKSNPEQRVEKVQEPAVQGVTGSEEKPPQDGTKLESEKRGPLEDQVAQNQLQKPAGAAGAAEEVTKAGTAEETQATADAVSTAATLSLDREEARVPARELKNISDEARTR